MKPRIAYFSMEIALESHIPTYSGGLGVLAGDLLRSAADLGFPMIGVSLLHRKGYFQQQIDSSGSQVERPVQWRPEDWLKPLDVKTHVTIEGRRVSVGAWEYRVPGQLGHVPVVLLDTDLPENSEFDRHLTDVLYGGDESYRFCQEIVLGIGGARLLRRMGQNISSFHMNEGHAALLALALLEADLGEADLSSATAEDIERVRERCIFTTHTPVAAGHDQFSRGLMERLLGKERASVLDVTHCCPDDRLNMSYLALRFSRYVNGVAMRHGEVAQKMFPQHAIQAITNGVHAGTWTSPPFQQLFDETIPSWRVEPQRLRYVTKLSAEQILETHGEAKHALLGAINPQLRRQLSADAFTIGFARRFTGYKRPTMLLTDMAKLLDMSKVHGPIQIIYAGKSHPQDSSGKKSIQEVHRIASSLPISGGLRIEFLEEYNLDLGKKLVAGVDLWLNTPQPPMEASGTSGMKAALNGVPSLSTKDGWWLEGHFQGVTGWSIQGGSSEEEATSLYSTLANEILPLYYKRPKSYGEVMRSTIAINGSFFNTHRMLEQYMREAYGSLAGPETGTLAL